MRCRACGKEDNPAIVCNRFFEMVMFECFGSVLAVTVDMHSISSVPIFSTPFTRTSSRAFKEQHRQVKYTSCDAWIIMFVFLVSDCIGPVVKASMTIGYPAYLYGANSFANRWKRMHCVRISKWMLIGSGAANEEGRALERSSYAFWIFSNMARP